MNKFQPIQQGKFLENWALLRYQIGQVISILVHGVGEGGGVDHDRQMAVLRSFPEALQGLAAHRLICGSVTLGAERHTAAVAIHILRDPQRNPRPFGNRSHCFD